MRWRVFQPFTFAAARAVLWICRPASMNRFAQSSRRRTFFADCTQHNSLPPCLRVRYFGQRRVSTLLTI